MNTLQSYMQTLQTLRTRLNTVFIRLLLGGLIVGGVFYWLEANDPWIIFGGTFLGATVGFLTVVHDEHSKQNRSRDDSGNMAPISLLIVAVAAIAFQSLIFAEEFAQESFIPSMEVPNCNVYGSGIAEGIERIGCYIGAFFITIGNLILLIGGMLLFLGNALTFNIPGAPWYVRIMMTIVFCGGVAWPLIAMFRGTRA